MVRTMQLHMCVYTHTKFTSTYTLGIVSKHSGSVNQFNIVKIFQSFQHQSIKHFG